MGCSSVAGQRPITGRLRWLKLMVEHRHQLTLVYHRSTPPLCQAVIRSCLGRDSHPLSSVRVWSWSSELGYCLVKVPVLFFSASASPQRQAPPDPVLIRDPGEPTESGRTGQRSKPACMRYREKANREIVGTLRTCSALHARMVLVLFEYH